MFVATWLLPPYICHFVVKQLMSGEKEPGFTHRCVSHSYDLFNCSLHICSTTFQTFTSKMPFALLCRSNVTFT